MSNIDQYYELARFCADDPKNCSHLRLRHFQLKTVMAPIFSEFWRQFHVVKNYFLWGPSGHKRQSMNEKVHKLYLFKFIVCASKTHCHFSHLLFQGWAKKWCSPTHQIGWMLSFLLNFPPDCIETLILVAFATYRPWHLMTKPCFEFSRPRVCRTAAAGD